MPKKEPTAVTTTRIVTKGGIITALITLIGTLIVAYWQFVLKPNTQSQPTETQYVGRVMDASSLLPISGAKITFDLYGIPEIAYTDSEGVYQFSVLIDSESVGQIRVDAQGFQPYIRKISILPNKNSIDDIRLSPEASTSTISTQDIVPTAAPTLAPTTTPASVATTSSQADEQRIVELIDNYYACLNNANPDYDRDYEVCWDLLSSYPDEYQAHLNKNEFIDFWKQYRVTYVLYYCPRGLEKHVDTEYYLYQRSDLSAPIGNGRKYILEYSFALDNDGWRIKSGIVLHEKISSDCEEYPRIERLSLFP